MAQDVTIDIKFKILSDINKKVDKIEKSFVGLEKQTNKTSKALVGLGGAIAGFIGTRALFNFTKDAVLGFARFEKAVIEVNTLLPDAQKNVRGLTKQLSALSVEFGTDRVAQAKGLYQTISSGFVDAAESAKILAASNTLALGGLTDIRTAVGGVTAVLKSYGRGSESASKVTDIFFQTIKNARTTAEELGQSISVVTGLGANLGISFESLSAALGTLTLNGTDTATAAVQLRQILASILKPTAEATQEAKKLGIEFNAAAVRSQGLGKFLLDLRKRLDGNDDSVAKLFGNVRALSGIIQLTSGDLENYNKLLKDNENALGAAAKAADEVKKSTDFKLKVLTAQWQRFKDVIGDSVVNALFDLAKAYEDTIDRIDKASKKDSFFANLTKGILATIGIDVEKQAKTSFTSGATTPGPSAGGVSGAITPGGEFTGVSTGFFTALDGFAAAFKSTAEKAANAISGVFTAKNIAGFLKGGAGGARALAKSIGNAVGAAFGVPGAGELVELLSLPPEKFRELIDQFFKAIPQIIEAIATNIPVLIEAFVENIDPIIDAIVEAIPLIIQKLLELLADPNFWVKVFNSFLSILTLGILDSFKPVISIFQGVAGAFAGAVSGFNGVVNFFKNVIEDLKNFISNFGFGGGGGGGNIIDKALSVFGFSNGGDIPNLTRFNNDNFPARLSAGEAVITASTTERLNRFLDKAESSGNSQPIVIQTVVGEETLAETITNLDLKGYRLGGVF